ncbi:GNAT family N-acetyltransferase [Aeromicrobium sp.]|uniref:GNAT family N-acetyltransferase n=1 Tax=Aeromicrobium sp. TaxID=1871063 RepID=UPI00198539BD|nr:GNAT family N-acetyltransferase [Aeromicrobium sp.]MBC7630370.1 GNAT family N-acetyltransferase [Aeromicrobium sp.]
MDAVMVRPWSDGDAAEVAALLASDATPVWANQGHALHGPAWREGRRWRQTWVAERAGHLIGAVTVATNRVHDGRLLCAVEVAEQHRRRGVGSELLRQAYRGAPDSRPLAAKVAPDSAGHHFVAAVGGLAYQRCDGVTLDPSSPNVQAWAAGAVAPHGARVEPLDGWAHERLVAAFVEQYLWVHEGWSPVTSLDALDDVARSTIDEHDATMGSVAVVDGHLAALVLAFPAGDHQLEVVAETQSRSQPHGAAVLAAALARTVTAAAAAGMTALELDGHVTDPHLHPLLQSAPVVTSNPLLLVEHSSQQAGADL